MPESLRPFQRQFVRAVRDPRINRAVLSVPRGNGKSWLSGLLVASSLSPGEALHAPGVENVLLSGSLDQARFVYRFAKQFLEATGVPGYSFQDSRQQMGITHKPTDTRLKVVSSRARGAFGLVNARLAIADEPGAWDVINGQMMADAIDTSLSKPGQDLTAIYVGTLAPSVSGWWHELCYAGSHGSTYVQLLQGRAERWDQWSEIRRCNPLVNVSPEFRRGLLEERDNARHDEGLKARFCSFRLNLPRKDSRQELLDEAEWKRVRERPVGAAEGRPIVGADIAGERGWSACVAIWPKTSRVEAFAYTPGIPLLDKQERRDRVPGGYYARMVTDCSLLVAAGQHVPEPKLVVDEAFKRWPNLVGFVCDRFRLPQLLDRHGGGPPWRTTR